MRSGPLALPSTLPDLTPAHLLATLLPAFHAPTLTQPLPKSQQAMVPPLLLRTASRSGLATALSQGPCLYSVIPPMATADWTGDKHAPQAGPMEFSALGIWNWDSQTALQALQLV